MKKGIFVATSNVANFDAALTMLEDTEKGRPGMAMAFGPAGMGKTMAAMRAYATRGGAYVRTMEQMSQAAFLGALCFEVSGSRPNGAHACKTRIIEALEAHPRTLFVDEADRLDIRRIEDLRDIHDTTGCPAVLIGEQGLPTKVGARARIDDRIPDGYRIKFEPIKAKDILVFAQEAAGLALTPEACALAAAETKGNFRRVFGLVLSLEQAARAANTAEVSADMVRRVAA